MLIMNKVLVCFLALSAASSTWISNGLPETEQSVDDWKCLGKPGGDHQIEVTIAICQTNKEWLEKKLWLVSDPFSKEYGNYMNFDEIAKYVHGKEESVTSVENALKRSGVDLSTLRYTIGKDFAIVKIPVSIGEELFSADFYQFTDGTVTIVKSPEYTIPASIKDHVDFVSGISEFPRPNKVKTHKSVNPQLNVNPKFINSEYNVSGYSANNTKNSQAVAGFIKQYFSPKDLEDFQKANSIPLKPIVKIVGENNDKDPGTEADVDVQYLCSIGRNVDTWFISTSSGQEDIFVSWITLQVNTTDSPWVHSVSYGGPENEVSQEYVDRLNTELQKFGVSGRTVFFASGDSGVDCRESSGLFKYNPEWPASSPYLTTVGGTSTIDHVWNMSGGGFSNIQPMPDYQKQAVQKYLSSGVAPSTKYFNQTGRAYPDVSTFAVGFSYYHRNAESHQDGTSCSAPTFAGIVSLLNDIRLNNNQPTLGFMNPLLYGTLMGQGFIDVTEGDNRGFLPTCDGFKATTGWDPASGWGQPNFGLLKTLVMQ